MSAGAERKRWIEIGPKDIQSRKAVTVRRDTMEKGFISFEDLTDGVSILLNQIQESMWKEAAKYQADNTYEVQDYLEFKSIMETKRGLIKTFWCENSECEEKVKEETQATIRVVFFFFRKDLATPINIPAVPTPPQKA